MRLEQFDRITLYWLMLAALCSGLISMVIYKEAPAIGFDGVVFGLAISLVLALRSQSPFSVLSVLKVLAFVLVSFIAHAVSFIVAFAIEIAIANTARNSGSESASKPVSSLTIFVAGWVGAVILAVSAQLIFCTRSAPVKQWAMCLLVGLIAGGTGLLGWAVGDRLAALFNVGAADLLTSLFLWQLVTALGIGMNVLCTSSRSA